MDQWSLVMREGGGTMRVMRRSQCDDRGRKEEEEEVSEVREELVCLFLTSCIFQGLQVSSI